MRLITINRLTALIKIVWGGCLFLVLHIFWYFVYYILFCLCCGCFLLCGGILFNFGLFYICILFVFMLLFCFVVRPRGGFLPRGSGLPRSAQFAVGADGGAIMAPFPDEVDVFTGPHWRMKQLVGLYSEKVRVWSVLCVILPTEGVFKSFDSVFEER